MNKEFLEKIKKELRCDYLDFYKEWENYKAFVFGNLDGCFGVEQVLLFKDNDYRIATEEERCIILDLI